MAAGVQLMNWFAVACELHRWRNDIEGDVDSLQDISEYKDLMTSYSAAASK